MRAFVPALADRRLLPQGGTRLTPWLIGVLMFVAVLVGAAGLAIANAAATVASGAEQRWSIQLPAGGRSMGAVVAAAGQAQGVAAVSPVPDEQVRGLLQRWLGPEAASADLPVPGLIDVELRPGANGNDLQRRVAVVAPGARVQSFPEQLGPMLRGLRTLQGLTFALLVLLGAAIAAAVMLATRGAYDTHRSTVAVLHGIGATDQQLAALFQQRMARETLVGGSAGAIVALVLVLLMLATLDDGTIVAVGGSPLKPLDIILLGALPFATALLALLVARATIIAALRADP
ncbi:permease [Sphingomonas sp. BN140010]|uniref:Permease n=1 Tax=Sphingomonas arvum TaxID=2992113 RepID=A0ABT3JG23_9SPHN|nr:permease [Sphingomonas sp. BN140010]MCW3797756.1 permease [Sphingomonas sp. BN140010]